MLCQFYLRVVEIVKKIIGNQNEIQVVDEFKKCLEDQSMFFNDEKILENESNKDVFVKCISMEMVKIYCFKWYKVMLMWFDFVNSKYI